MEKARGKEEDEDFPIIIHVIVLCILVIIKNVIYHANT